MISKNIALAGEITPAKTFIPIIERLMELEKENKLNFKINKMIGLYHGESAKDFLKPYCDELYYIGEGRRGKKNSKPKLVYLISRDILKSFNALRGKNVDLLITAGNAGDVRKSIVAANILRIPVIHIEQDIYNPIEVISQANLVTVPSQEYKEYLKNNYKLDNVVNINGYPMAKYVDDYIRDNNLIDKEEIYAKYGIEDFVLVVLGGDLKDGDIDPLIKSIEKLDRNVLIAPYRFDRNMVEKLVSSSRIKVLPQYVDLLSFMNAASQLIYAAGMGMTIEAGVFNIPSLKIEGFHTTHGSVDLAKSLNIPIVKIDEIPEAFENLAPQNDTSLLEDSENSIEKVVNIINEFNPKSLKRSGFKSTKEIWNSRKAFR